MEVEMEWEKEWVGMEWITVGHTWITQSLKFSIDLACILTRAIELPTAVGVIVVVIVIVMGKENRLSARLEKFVTVATRP